MRYQITYYSPCGYAKLLADAFYEALPYDTYVSNLEKKTLPWADIQLIGFELNGINLEMIPFKVIEYLEILDKKKILLFVTVPFQYNDSIKGRIEKYILPFLSDNCDYLGMYLCSAQPSQTLVDDVKKIIEQQPDNENINYWLELCQSASGHPDREDIQNGCEFIKNILTLEE